LTILLNSKRFNPYCIRHSSISCDSDWLPEYALKKKVRWSMNSRQGARYIKTRMGNELKSKILEYNGIVTKNIAEKVSVPNCPRCDLVNVIENKYCSKCRYPLKPEGFDEIKEEEQNKVTVLEKKYNEMNNTLQNILYVLSNINEEEKPGIAKVIISKRKVWVDTMM
jgi:integrase/recombinase XerD